MATITRFEDLEVWQTARAFAESIFHLYSNSDLFSRDYKLKDQINGASGSIMDNIAEGFERSGRKEFLQFLAIAKGSVGEVKSQLYRALDRKYITEEIFNSTYQKADELGKKIGGFMNYLNKSTFKGTKFKGRSDS
ncbi:MAG: four helix bundle protein [Flavisolibacter sp.]